MLSHRYVVVVYLFSLIKLLFSEAKQWQHPSSHLGYFPSYRVCWGSFFHRGGGIVHRIMWCKVIFRQMTIHLTESNGCISTTTFWKLQRPETHFDTQDVKKHSFYFYNFIQNKRYKISLCSLQCTYHIVITNYKSLMTNSCWMPLIYERSPPNNESIPRRRLKSLDDNVFISCTKLTVSPDGRLGVGHIVSR